jgi:hypothetical protein
MGLTGEYSANAHFGMQEKNSDYAKKVAVFQDRVTSPCLAGYNCTRCNKPAAPIDIRTDSDSQAVSDVLERMMCATAIKKIVQFSPFA